MKKLFTSISYSFSNFYDNLNTQGQMVFSLIVILILGLFVILLFTYIIEGIKTKKYFAKVKKQMFIKPLKKESKKEIVMPVYEQEVKKEPVVLEEQVNPVAVEPVRLNTEEEKILINDTNVIEEEKHETKIEDIASAIKDALEEENPISLTDFEEDQEKEAIISIDELVKRAKELELIDDDNEGINYLEKYNLEPAEVEAVSNKINTAEKKEVKAFRVSQVISPIYGVKKDAVNDKEA